MAQCCSPGEAPPYKAKTVPVESGTLANTFPVQDDSCEPGVPTAGCCADGRTPFDYKATIRKLTNAPAGQPMVITEGAFLNLFRPPQSGPLSYDRDRNVMYAGPLAEFVARAQAGDIYESGWFPIIQVVDRMVDGVSTKVMRIGVQQVQHRNNGHLGTIDVDEDGKVRHDQLIPIETDSPDGDLRLIGYKKTTGDEGEPARRDWYSVALSDYLARPSSESAHLIHVAADGTPTAIAAPSTSAGTDKKWFLTANEDGTMQFEALTNPDTNVAE